MNPELKRREFLQNTLAAGLSAPLLSAKLAAQTRRPLVISSSNDHLGADGKFLNGGINFDINFYALNKKGEYGGAALWGMGEEGKKSSFAVHDGKEARLIESIYLYQKK